MSLAGFACSMLGGYVAALIAKRHELLNGGLSSFYFVLTTLFQMTRGHNYYPLLVQVLLLIAGSASAVLGGYLRSRRRAIQYAPQTDSELIRK
jgi:ABC-type branched-subunit amino acid transport system permease subunit